MNHNTTTGDIIDAYLKILGLRIEYCESIIDVPNLAARPIG